MPDPTERPGNGADGHTGDPMHAIPLILASLLAGPAPALTEDWPGFRGDGTGRAVSILARGDGPVALELRWKRDLGSGYAGIALAEGLLVTAFGDGEHDLVAALDPETGAERWRHALAETSPGNDGSHAGPIGTPAIGGGRVFALGPRGDLVGLGLSDGAELWRVQLVNDLGCEKPLYGYAASPALVADTLVLPVGCETGAVAGFDAATGAVRWRAGEDGFFAQSAVVAELAGRRQVVLLGEKSLFGLDPESGELLWSFAHEGAPGSEMGSLTQSPMPIGGDRLFLKHENASALVVQVSSDEQGWHVTREHQVKGLNRSYSPPTLWGEQAYGFTARFLSALDLETGELLWRSREPGDGFVLSSDGMLAVLTKEGSLHLGAASPVGWQELARLDLFEDLAWTPPSASGNGIYVRSFGEIARVDVERTAPAAHPDDAANALPASLAPLAAGLAGGGPAAAAVDAFLEGRRLPLIDGDEVVFLWRGEARDVAIAGHMIGMRREEQMRRLPGTDLWWWSTRLDRRARVNYLFYVDYEPTPDPANPLRTRSTILGNDMNWLREDPVPMSWFAMPEWPGLASEAPRPTARGRIEKVTLQVQPPDQPEAEPVAVEAHVWLPPGYDEGDQRYPVAFVHSPWARELMGWPETLDAIGGVRIPPLIAVLVEAPRMSGFSRAFVDQVVPVVDERFRTRRDAASRANVGMGPQSLLAAVVGLRHRESFGRLGLQTVLALDEELATIDGLLADEALAKDPLRVYLEWGHWDLNSPHENMDMRASARLLRERLEAHGIETVGGEVWDSTDVASWRNRTAILLEALFPLEGDQAPADLGAWLVPEP